MAKVATKSTSKQSKSKRQLGKGLSQLLGEETENPTKTPEAANALKVETLPLSQLKPGVYQPRSIFNSEKLDSLSASIKENGVLQPILVRRSEDGFEIIAGERRWRAAKAAGLTEIPVVETEFTDEQALESGLIENIQRDDLTPIEEATAYKKLMDEFGYSQEQISQKIGKSRSHVANMVRLLSLPQKVQDYVTSGQLSAGHARVLVGYEEAEEIADKIIQKGMNVRQLERYMVQVKSGTLPANSNSSRIDDPDKVNIERQLSQLLGYKTKLRINAQGAGDIVISVKDMTDIDVLMQTLMKMRGYAA